MRTAREEPGSYGAENEGVEMAFSVLEQQEGEDYYIILLTFRPQGNFSGNPGSEEFFITKEGSIDHRQVMGLPSKADNWEPIGNRSKYKSDMTKVPDWVRKEIRRLQNRGELKRLQDSGQAAFLRGRTFVYRIEAGNQGDDSIFVARRIKSKGKSSKNSSRR